MAKRKAVKRRWIARKIRKTVGKVRRARKATRKIRKTVGKVRKVRKTVRKVRKVTKAARRLARLAKARKAIKARKARKVAAKARKAIKARKVAKVLRARLARARKAVKARKVIARARKAKARAKAVRKARRGKNGNPQLLVISNPCPKATYPPTAREIAKTNRAYKRFHFTRPVARMTADVPRGFPSAYMVIGELERFDTKTPTGRIVSRRYGSGSPRPVLCTTAAMKDLYIFDARRLGIPAGAATRCDYRVPAHSGRNKWARRWWHPHDTTPAVQPHTGGKAVRVSGRGLSVRPEGIVG